MKRTPLIAWLTGLSLVGTLAGQEPMPGPGVVAPNMVPYGPPGMPYAAGSYPPPVVAPFPGMVRPRRMRELSWIQIDSLAPRQMKVHDILTVVVNEASEVTQNSRFDRQRNATFKFDIREFIRIGETGNLRPAALDNPKIDTQMRNTFNSLGNATSREGMRYRIAATVVDVLPNGTLVLEARKTIHTNGEMWEYRLTGQARSEDVQANNTVLSENIANLHIDKNEHGKVKSSTDRGWLMRMYDALKPF